MGTIVYSSLIELLLKEGDKTREEMVNESINRFGFPKDSLEGNIGIGLVLKEVSGFISKDEKGKYHLNKITEGMLSVKDYLKRLEKAPKEYLKDRPHIKKLKGALEEIYQNDSQ